MTRYTLILASLLALALPTLAGAADTKPAAAAQVSAPAQFVQKLGDNALISLTSKELARTTRENRMRALLNANFDIPVIGRSALGPYWKEATEKQKTEYMSLFEDMIVKTYTSRFEDYSGQTLKVDGTVTSGQKDSIVTSQIIQKDGPPVSLEWRVRSKDGGYKIVDVLVEGVSMGVTQRSDFVSVIQQGGGKIDALIATLRERMAPAKK